MPIYEYKCDACNHKFENIQKFSDKLLETCPECKENKLRKLVSAAAFRLKGTGWYATDFKDKKPSQGSDKSDEKSATEKKAEGDKTSKSTESNTKKTESSDTKKTESKSTDKTPKSSTSNSD